MMLQSTMNNNHMFNMTQAEMTRRRFNEMAKNENYFGASVDKQQLMRDLKHYINLSEKEKIALDIYNNIYSKENILKAARKIGIEINEPQLHDKVSKYFGTENVSMNPNAWYILAIASIKKADAEYKCKTEFAYEISFMIMEVFAYDTSKLQQLILKNNNLSSINILKNKRDKYAYYCYRCVSYILNTICNCARE